MSYQFQKPVLPLQGGRSFSSRFFGDNLKAPAERGFNISNAKPEASSHQEAWNEPFRFPLVNCPDGDVEVLRNLSAGEKAVARDFMWSCHGFTPLGLPLRLKRGSTVGHLPGPGNLSRMSNDGGPEGAFPKRQLRYAFQHVVLPEAAFLNHPALIDQLGRSMPLVLYRSKALIHCEMAGLLQFDETDGDALLEMMRLFEPMTVDTYAQNGYTAYVVTMPPPEFPADAFFIAMVYKDDEPKTHGTTSPSTRYFTLEKSSLSEEPFLCEWKSNRAHLNYDVGPPAEVAPFVEAVFQRVLN